MNKEHFLAAVIEAVADSPLRLTNPSKYAKTLIKVLECIPSWKSTYGTFSCKPKTTNPKRKNRQKARRK